MTEKALVLCTHQPGTDPTLGPVEYPSFRHRPGVVGFRGLLWGEGRGLDLKKSLYHFLVVEVPVPEIVMCNGAAVFHKGVILFCGACDEAIQFIKNRDVKGRVRAFIQDVIEVGPHLTAVTGWGGSSNAATSGKALTGDHGKAVAGLDGMATAGDHGTAIVGRNGTAVAGFEGSAISGKKGTALTGPQGLSLSGEYGQAFTEGGGIAIVGARGFAVAYQGHVQAGEGGCICIRWFDGDCNRMRCITGTIGEDGLEPDVLYTHDGTRFIPVPSIGELKT